MPLAARRRCFSVAYERYAGDYLSSLQKVLGTGTLRERLTAFFDLTIKNFRSGSPPRGCPTTRGLMELGSVEGEGLDENARQAFADLVARITGLIQDALSEGTKRGEFKGEPASAALHIVTVTRGLAVLERAFGDEAQLRKIAAHTIDLVLGNRLATPVRFGVEPLPAPRRHNPHRMGNARHEFARARRPAGIEQQPCPPHRRVCHAERVGICRAV